MLTRNLPISDGNSRHPLKDVALLRASSQASVFASLGDLVFGAPVIQHDGQAVFFESFKSKGHGGSGHGEDS